MSFQRFVKSFTKVSSAFCWFWDCSVCLMVSLACSSVCCDAFVTLSTLKTYQPNWVLTGPSSSFFFAEKTASSSSLSSVPLAWAGSLPPAALEVSSIEYFFATAFQLCPL